MTIGLTTPRVGSPARRRRHVFAVVELFGFTLERHRPPPRFCLSASELRTSSLVKHSPENLHLLLDHICGGVTANEHRGMAKSIPEIVYLLRFMYLLGLLADES